MIFAANWKMHMSPAEARRFAQAFLQAVPLEAHREIWFFPSAVTLGAAVGAFRRRPDVRCGVQDVYWENSGAFTGAISAPLAASAGATVALVGHSERRQVFGETEEDTRRKVAAVLAGQLTPLLCVGETLKQREEGETMAVVLRQLQTALGGLDPDDVDRILVAYEPVWAIGTGQNATPEDAARVHALIRTTLDGLGASNPRVLYGGSVKPDNVEALLSQREVDGVLVGGASLDPGIWAEVVLRGSAACSG